MSNPINCTYSTSEPVQIPTAAYLDMKRLREAECKHTESKAALTPLADEVHKAWQRLNAMKSEIDTHDCDPVASSTALDTVLERINCIEKRFSEFESRLNKLEKLMLTETDKSSNAKLKNVQAAAAKNDADDDDDGVDLFGSDSESEDEAAAKVRQERLAAYSAKKSNKPQLIAKSNIILDVKPWDDETDMKLLEAAVRDIKIDGLLWGASKLVPLAYGIHKLQISCVVEDELVSVDLLIETIEQIEDYVQSIDIAAFNKV